MNSADLLNALPGVTVVDTVPANGSVVGFGYALAILGVLSMVATVSLAITFYGDEIVITFLSLIMGVLCFWGCYASLSSPDAVTKYVVEIAEDAPSSSTAIIFQNFKTVEVDGNTYTLAENN